LDRCESCKGISRCTECGRGVTRFDHLGVRATTSQAGPGLNVSGIWHYARPCGHRAHVQAAARNVKYNGGPLWQNGYSWQNVYWGTYFTTATAWVRSVEKATADIEADSTYSVGLAQYNVGIGRFAQPAIIKTAPPTRLSDSQLRQALTSWIASGAVQKLETQGAYNIFLPPGVTITLAPSESSCAVFCDYHNAVNGSNGPFYTVEPYPCSKGCNQCTGDPFDTLTQGLSEEMVELKTDMDPGTGWVIGNEELCDFCDHHFVCNRISTGEYVNAWYDQNKRVCWTGTGPAQNPAPTLFQPATKSRVGQQ